MFPISRDPPEGGTTTEDNWPAPSWAVFPISRDPPEGGTAPRFEVGPDEFAQFPISRDPPEGGTDYSQEEINWMLSNLFPISRDPPEGGTSTSLTVSPRFSLEVSNF